MASNFEHFFGYENAINRNPDLVLLYGYAFIVFGGLMLIFIAFILRKISLSILVSKFINPLILSMGICLLVAIPPTVIFKIVANNLTGVKLIYIWFTIFTGITLFTFLRYQEIKKLILSKS